MRSFNQCHATFMRATWSQKQAGDYCNTLSSLVNSGADLGFCEREVVCWRHMCALKAQVSRGIWGQTIRVGLIEHPNLPWSTTETYQSLKTLVKSIERVSCPDTLRVVIVKIYSSQNIQPSLKILKKNITIEITLEISL